MRRFRMWRGAMALTLVWAALAGFDCSPSPPDGDGGATGTKTLPSPSNAGTATGGGPIRLPGLPSGGSSGAGDAAAAARLDAQFPVVGDDYVLNGTTALKYLGLLARVFPELRSSLTTLQLGASCAQKYGVVGAKAYLTRDLSEAGVMVVVSYRQAQQLPSIALRCIVSDVTGGGPTPDDASRAFEPCFTSFSIDDVTADGVSDHYYVYTAGTNAAWCSLVTNFHQAHNEQPISAS